MLPGSTPRHSPTILLLNLILSKQVSGLKNWKIHRVRWHGKNASRDQRLRRKNTTGFGASWLGKQIAPIHFGQSPPNYSQCLRTKELQEGVKLIDFSELRKPGTAVFIVVPEGATQVYQEFIATFFGQTIFDFRLDNTREPEHPVLVAIDEAANWMSRRCAVSPASDVGAESGWH